jgi:hypothetical protein
MNLVVYKQTFLYLIEQSIRANEQPSFENKLIIRLSPGKEGESIDQCAAKMAKQHDWCKDLTQILYCEDAMMMRRWSVV